jgi:hypothetical protein
VVVSVPDGVGVVSGVFLVGVSVVVGVDVGEVDGDLPVGLDAGAVSEGVSSPESELHPAKLAVAHTMPTLSRNLLRENLEGMSEINDKICKVFVGLIWTARTLLKQSIQRICLSPKSIHLSRAVLSINAV